MNSITVLKVRSYLGGCVMAALIGSLPAVAWSADSASQIPGLAPTNAPVDVLPASPTGGTSGFVVRNIRIDGLQRLPAARVYRLIPLNEGDRLTPERTSAVIKALYRTGDFENVELLRDSDTLIVKVAERPSIAKVEFKGNKSISKDDLRKGLKMAHLSEGDVYKRSTVAAITGELKRQYVAQGRYAAHVEADVSPMSRNRVALKITIYEGKPARIKNINIVGNKAFSDKELLAALKLRSSHFTSFFKGDDKYSRDKLAGDLENLRSFYLDRGYIRFQVESVQVSVTPDKDHVFITANVREGEPYTIGKVSLEGNIPVDEEQLKPLVLMKPGQLYSQQAQTATDDLISRRLGNAGYTFAKVRAFPQIDDDKRTVDVAFFVEPGNRVYVNNITFSGNDKTQDRVLRRELRQFESAPANTSLISLSKDRLERLGYFSKVEANTEPVPGTDDQVDVDYNVEEQPSGSIGANVGYSDADGVIFGGSISQNNFMGTGNQVSFALSRSNYSQRYSFSHYNPYYTQDGVSRGFSLHYSKINFDNARVNIASYAADRKGGDVTYGYPVSEYSRIHFGFGYDDIDITSGDYVPQSIFEFMQDEGSRFKELTLNLGFSTSTLNNGFLPDRGWSQRTNLEIGTPASDYKYYKLTVDAEKYFPLTGNWLLRSRGRVGYGDGLGGGNGLPFFENFYAGGIGSVRGYRSFSLGPRSPAHNIYSNNKIDGDPDPVGGNLLTEASLELIFPTPFAAGSRNVRTFLFADAGRVEERKNDYLVDERYSSKFRYSAGIGLSWLTAIGPLSFSVGKALNKESGDDTEVFQFSLGQTF